MAKRKDIKSILVVGAGPIIIGQACEFDYSGTQACKALMEEGYRVILINSNPATIMTDPETADVVYIEPITPDDDSESGLLPGFSMFLTVLSLTIGLIYSTRRD